VDRRERRTEELKKATPTERTPTALRSLLNDATAHATKFLEELPERRVAPTATAEELRKVLAGPLPDSPGDPRRVIAELARAVEPGLMATAGGRFFASS
jgi:hypothetical protein